jgi:hypothetical protein
MRTVIVESGLLRSNCHRGKKALVAPTRTDRMDGDDGQDGRV